MSCREVLEEAGHFGEFAASTDDIEMKIHWYKQACVQLETMTL